MDQMKASLLDEKALKAGAADCIWYTDDNLIARERLKHDRDVVDALDRAWRLIRPHSEQIDHEDYIVMSRKIYLAIKADSCEGKITAAPPCTCSAH